MNDKNSIQPGRYRHYKGNEYTVIGTARHSETLEEMVVYRQEYGDHGLRGTLWGGNMMRPQPLICIRDVEASSRWYQRLLGCESAHGGPNYERLVFSGKLILQLQALQSDRQIEAQKLQVAMYRAQTERMRANSEIAARNSGTE